MSIFTGAGSLINGMGNAVGSIWQGATKGISNLTSNFFPAQSKPVIQSSITQPAAGTIRSTESYQSAFDPTFGTNVLDELKTPLSPAPQIGPTVARAQYLGLEPYKPSLFENIKSFANTTLKTLKDVNEVVPLASFFGGSSGGSGGSDGGASGLGSLPSQVTGIADYFSGFGEQIKGLFGLANGEKKDKNPAVKQLDSTTSSASKIIPVVIIIAIIIGVIYFAKRK